MHILDQLDPRRPSVCAHRGDSRHAPENTLSALRAAARAGAALCEIDVRRLSDGTLVLMHDRTVDRTTDGTGLVNPLPFEILRSLDAGRWFSDAFAGERVPTFREALACAHDEGLGLMAEIKDREADADWLASFAAEIADVGMSDRVVATSFDHRQLRLLKDIAPAMRTLGIAHVRPVDPVAFARLAGLDAVVLEFPYYWPEDARALREAGVTVACAVLRPQDFDRFVAFGAPDLTRLHEIVSGGSVSLMVVDDVRWVAALAPSLSLTR